MQKADELIKNRNYSKAANLLEQIIEEYPDHINALYKAGMCYIKSGEPLKAKAKFESLVELDPKDTELWQQYSFSLFQLGEITSSINALKNADIHNPDDFLIHHQIAYLYFQQKNYKKALKYINKAIELNDLQNNNRPIMELLSLKALISESINKDEAVKVYFEIIDNFETAPNAYDKASSLLIEKFKFSNNFKNLNLNTADYHEATFFLREGNLNKAVDSYKEIINKDKYCYPAYLGISQALYENNFGTRDIVETAAPKEIEKLFINYEYLNNAEKNIINNSVLFLENYLEKLIKKESHFIIVPIDTKLTDYPANLHLKNKNYIEDVTFCSLRGIGGDHAFVGVERVRDLLWNVDYSMKFIPACIAHEFGHMVWAELDKKITSKINKLYEKTKENKNFISLYSQTNVQEYFAEYYAYCSRLISADVELPENDSMVNIIKSLKNY